MAEEVVSPSNGNTATDSGGGVVPESAITGNGEVTMSGDANAAETDKGGASPTPTNKMTVATTTATPQQLGRDLETSWNRHTHDDAATDSAVVACAAAADGTMRNDDPDGGGCDYVDTTPEGSGGAVAAVAVVGAAASSSSLSTSGGVASAQRVMNSARRTLDAQISALSDRDPTGNNGGEGRGHHPTTDGSGRQPPLQGLKKATMFSDQYAVASYDVDSSDYECDSSSSSPKKNKSDDGDETEIINPDDFDDAKTSITFAGQTELPPLPIPSLEETLNKFLKSLEALQDYDEQKQAAKRVVLEFLQSDGPKLQQLLLDYDRNGRQQGLIGSYVEEFWNDAYLAPDSSVVMVRCPERLDVLRNRVVPS
jgi:hypothetical protein